MATTVNKSSKGSRQPSQHQSRGGGYLKRVEILQPLCEGLYRLLYLPLMRLVQALLWVGTKRLLPPYPSSLVSLWALGRRRKEVLLPSSGL
jgi:hypothetical protein